MGGTWGSLCTTVASLLIPAEVRFTRTVSTFGGLLSLADRRRQTPHVMTHPQQVKKTMLPITVPITNPTPSPAKRRMDHDEPSNTEQQTQMKSV